jgi:hypothetical protein
MARASVAGQPSAAVLVAPPLVQDTVVRSTFSDEGTTDLPLSRVRRSPVSALTTLMKVVPVSLGSHAAGSGFEKRRVCSEDATG